MTNPKPKPKRRYKRFSSEFKREALLRASEEGMTDKAGAAALNLQVAYDVRGGTVRAQLRNLGTALVKFQIVANEYRTDGSWTLPVAPKATAKRSWKVSDSGNWCDFTIGAPGFERRFAGRMENGGNLISDPAMGT
jgi:phospholipase C